MRKKLLILALLLITGLLPASSYTIKLKNKGDAATGLRVLNALQIKRNGSVSATINIDERKKEPVCLSHKQRLTMNFGVLLILYRKQVFGELPLIVTLFGKGIHCTSPKL